MDAVQNFIRKLDEFGRIRDEEDKVIWRASKSGVFSVWSFFVALEVEGEVTFPPKILWGSWASTKMVFFFAWKATWGQILTIDQLKRRGWVLAGFCCMCKDADESVDHLLIHCGIARKL